MSKAQFGGFAVVCFVLLRLAAGFHFYTEGVKKLEPGFSSEGFLRGAKGPLADYFGSFAPGLHGAYELLAEPRNWDDAAADDETEQDVLPGDPIEGKQWAQPYRRWAIAIDTAWQQQHDAAMDALQADKPTRERADAIYRDATASLSGYLTENEEPIADYQHSLARLEELKQSVKEEGGSLPYVDDRIASQEREARATARAWIDGVQALEDEYHDQLRALADGEEPAPDTVLNRLEAALNPPTTLDRINTIVTWVVLGCGVLLFLGLFTRVAAIVAAGFLMSVIATQPPWAFGADTTYLGYQLVEITSLLTLAAVGAGRWLGIDGLLGCLFYRCQSQTQTTNPPAA